MIGERMAGDNGRRMAALTGFAMGATLSWVSFWIISCYFKNKSKKEVKKKQIKEKKTPMLIPREMRDEQLSRHRLYFGSDGLKQIEKSKIAVVGLGGVGSHTAHMLVRGGIGHIRLIDFDQVTLSSLNRHACATLSDVGIPKVTCMERFLKRIVGGNSSDSDSNGSYCNIDSFVEMLTEENCHALLQLPQQQQWDVVVDAIDDIPTKAALLAYCIENNIRVVSCMGAGGKCDSTRLHISDLRTASKDPLATKLRQSLKKKQINIGKGIPSNTDENENENEKEQEQEQEQEKEKKKEIEKKTETETETDGYMDDTDQLTIVYSSENTVVKLADFTEEQKEDGFHHYGTIGDKMRIRIIPVLGTMPAIMGQTLASIALCHLGNKPIHNPVPGERVGRTVRNRIFQHFKRREDSITKRHATQQHQQHQLQHTTTSVWIGPLQIDLDDVEYLLQIWKNRCAITGDRLGTVLQLVRWDLSKPSTCDNIVLMSRSFIEKNIDVTPTISPNHSMNIPSSKKTIIQDRLTIIHHHISS